jgi:hypothetical protein
MAFSGLCFGHSLFSGFQRVSQTLASFMSFNQVTTYQTEPFSIFLSEIYIGLKKPTSRASIFFQECKKCKVSHFFISHENTFT